MTVATQAPPQTATVAVPTSAAVGDMARALLERQLGILGQLAEGGLEIARAIEREATQAGSAKRAPKGVGAHIPMAYARVSRAVRMTILLQSQLITDLQTLEAKAAQAAAQANSLNGTQRVCREHDQQRRIGRIVGRIALADDKAHGEANRLARETVERLEQDELYGDILTRPFSEIVAQICNDMGLEPNWPQLAEEAWAKAELNTGAAAAPLAAAMAKTAQARPPPLSKSVAQFTPHAASP
ncbi:MAG TPA: hypothetical protein VG960_08170 [Caulobacteraceae bacterium]|nr:hypothetical protein [Caulobacteraceae bacterium]